ncbi:MAG: XdhC family protein [Acidobacteriota bacterium]
MSEAAFHRELAQILDAGQTCATATLIDSVGSTPGKFGHRMIVLSDGTIRHTIGGGPLEANVIADCREQIARGTHLVKEYRLVPAGKGAVGMVCGGTARVFIEIHRPTDHLLVFGAGHVGVAVARMAAELGFCRVIADDRLDRLTPDVVPDGVEAVHCPDRYAAALPAVTERSYVVVVTRCHETDREIVARLAGSPMAYMGMIGSRRKVTVVLEELAKRGVAREHLDRLHAPIGLSIGARSPAEIALAILAEIVAVRNSAHDPPAAAG